MALIGMRNVGWGFGDPALPEDISFQIEKAERVCLVGRNGAGKSTLLKLLTGDLQADRGEVWRQQGITVAALEQEVPAGFDGTLFEVVAEGLGEAGRALAEHQRISRMPGASVTSERAHRREVLQQSLDQGGWSLLQRIETLLSRAGLVCESRFAELSAGLKRRALFARAMVMQPDVLILDEPTNHLDMDTIIWMEDFIRRHVKTLLFVSHDRAFVEKIATRIIELDRGRLVSYACDYAAYRKRRQADLEAEARQTALFDKRLSQEEAWIRQGIKARRTRNEGRVRALKKMREAYRARRRELGNVSLRLQEAERTGKLVIEAQRVSYARAGTPIVQDFSTAIMRGDKIGIIGPNGVGKTTLLRLLLKETAPDSGRVRHGTNLQVAYFDQLRTRLDERRTVRQNIGEGNDFIVFNGGKRHVVSYLQDFLFTPERCRTPVHILSGGEKNRLMLAKLLTQPANVLVLDEPTNDLDIETLELLEELLFEYPGTLLLVSHDRAFLNSVVTSTIAFEGRGQVIEYAGGYDDWLLQRPSAVEDTRPTPKTQPGRRPRRKPARPRRLGLMEKRELEELPQKIEALESEQNELYAAMSDPCFYKGEKTAIARVKTRLDQVEHAIEAAYARWESLEAIANA